MGEESDAELRRVAERAFRAAAINELTESQDEYALWNTYRGQPQDVCPDVCPLLDGLLQPGEPATRFAVQHDHTGNATSVVECGRAADELGSSHASMSLLRTPFLGVGASSIKGCASNVPFAPGGFDDGVENVLRFARETSGRGEDDEDTYLEMKDLLCHPPGFDAPVELANCEQKMTDVQVSSASPPDAIPTLDIDGADIFALMDFVGGGEPIVVPAVEEKETENEEEGGEGEGEEQAVEGVEELDAALAKPVREKEQEVVLMRSEFEYAHVLDCSREIEGYREEVLPNMAKKYPFELDPFQQAAVTCMEKGESVFVAAHTSAGKTVVAEYAIALCQKHKTRAIYTSPIKALSNQKFRDFKMIFGEVGLVTGDIQLNPEAFCLIMTTEILRSMLYNGSEVVRELEWVVFDEVHYINDAERGHVWEEVLIMLPKHVKIVMLSATVPNCIEFADWVGRIKHRRLNVVQTFRRPVPLEHHIYTGQDGKTKKDLFLILDAAGNFQMSGWNKAKEAKDALRKPTTGAKGPQGNRGGFGKNDKNVYMNLVDLLRSRDQLPMVCFVFSRKRCDENAQLLSSLDLTTAVEKSHVHSFFQQCIGRLKGTDKQLPQVLSMRELCLRGFAVHHSGILPILKEVVELLFQKGYVKILFATETFAMGVNMPARTVVFDNIQKHDGTELRTLKSGEYIQMAGRAGRRGLDSTGTVIVLAKGMYLPEVGELKTVMQGNATRLESRFRVTYSMLLNLLRVEQLRIEDMLQRSYVESVSLRQGRERKERLEKARCHLSSLISLECSTCVPPTGESLVDYHQALDTFLALRCESWPRVIALPAVDKLLNCGRVLICSSAREHMHNALCLLLKVLVNGAHRSLQVLVCCDESEEARKGEETRAWDRRGETDRSWEEESCRVLSAARWGVEGCSPSTANAGRRVFRVVELPLSALVAIARKQLKVDVADVLNTAKLREQPRFRSAEFKDSLAKNISELDKLSSEWSGKEVDVIIPTKDMAANDMDTYDALRAVLSARADLLRPDAYPAKHCARFDQHMGSVRVRARAVRNVRQLEYELSADNLLLNREYRDRLQVLKALHYVDKGNIVGFKGRVACEIHHQELLITELILENKLYTRSAAEVAALLSATTCQYKNNQGVKFEPGSVFDQLRSDVEEVAAKISRVSSDLKVQLVDVGDELRFDLMEVVYHWAQGVPFSEIMAMTEAQEGIIVRCIQRLGEVCKDVRNAARIVGDPALHEKMEQVSASIKRDIVFAASLYTSL